MSHATQDYGPEVFRLLASCFPYCSPKTSNIIREVANKHRVATRDILSSCKLASVVKARWEIIHRLRFEEGYSLKKIARCLGRDHSTILHALRKFKPLPSQSNHVD